MESKKINEVQNWDQKGCPDNPKVRILRFECIDQFEIKHVHAPPPPPATLRNCCWSKCWPAWYKIFTDHFQLMKMEQKIYMELPWVAKDLHGITMGCPVEVSI